jgi:hypothetical protein
MEPAGDMDPVLRSLGADLERDDPALAALLSGRKARHRHWPAWFLLALPLLIPAFLLPARMVLGLLATLLILASPLVVLWLCAGTDDPATGRT